MASEDPQATVFFAPSLALLVHSPLVFGRFAPLESTATPALPQHNLYLLAIMISLHKQATRNVDAAACSCRIQQYAGRSI